MFAIIETGGKQYKVKEDQKIFIEKINVAPGDSFVFKNVVLFASNDSASESNSILHNSSDLSNVEVVGEVVKHFRDEKVIIFKHRRRKNSRRKNGHRQTLTVVMIKIVKIKKIALSQSSE